MFVFLITNCLKSQCNFHKCYSPVSGEAAKRTRVGVVGPVVSTNPYVFLTRGGHTAECWYLLPRPCATGDGHARPCAAGDGYSPRAPLRRFSGITDIPISLSLFRPPVTILLCTFILELRLSPVR